jgi:hypothetical protein
MSTTLWLLLVGVAALAGHFWGWSEGVRDTERRWEEAVERKRHHDEYEATRHVG